MKNSNQTKRALISSVLLLLFCFTMLLGSTSAWFTDAVISDVNTIKAGNLDVELLHADKAEPADTPVAADTKLFDDVTLWEPGAMVWEKLTVRNAGTLALKYRLTVNVANISDVNGKSLADVLKIAVLDEQPTRDNIKTAATRDLATFDLAADKELVAGASDDVYYVAIYWEPSENDNAYNVKKQFNAKLSVTLVATQLDSEVDGFDDKYDVDAVYPVAYDLPKADVSELTENITVDNQVLEAAYNFTAPHNDSNIGEQYKDWICDYYVSVDRDVPADSIYLAGQYDTYSTDWVGFSNGDFLVAANEEIPLMATMIELFYGEPFEFTYEIVASLVNSFNCGVARIGDALDGATFTVKLCLTNPDTGERFAVNTVNYTFN